MRMTTPSPARINDRIHLARAQWVRLRRTTREGHPRSDAAGSHPRGANLVEARGRVQHHSACRSRTTAPDRLAADTPRGPRPSKSVSWSVRNRERRAGRPRSGPRGWPRRASDGTSGSLPASPGARARWTRMTDTAHHIVGHEIGPGVLEWGVNCGRGGIRTHEPLARLTVFKTVAFVRSATLPRAVYLRRC